MKSIEEIHSILSAEFGENIVSVNLENVDPYIEVKSEAIDAICSYVRNNEQMRYDYLICLSGVDDANGTKGKDEEGNLTLSGGTLSIYYHICRLSDDSKFVIKTSVQRDNPQIKTVSNIWRGADWHEREAYDMYGIIFENHPDLRRILMPYDWEGYPLRKDYKNPEFYQGMKISAQ